VVFQEERGARLNKAEDLLLGWGGKGIRNEKIVINSQLLGGEK